MKVHMIRDENEIPEWTTRDKIAHFFHHNLKPYHDEVKDIQSALDYAFSKEKGKGGFIMLGEDEGELVAGLVMLSTGMKGYIPENLLVFVGVLPDRLGSAGNYDFKPAGQPGIALAIDGDRNGL